MAMKMRGLLIIFTLYNFSLFVWVRGQEWNCDLSAITCADIIFNATLRYPDYRDLRTPELIERLGYPVESHEVKTEDGYILTLHRIPNSNKSLETSGKVPVLVMHGLLASSVSWVWQPPSRGLIFMLADAGYDVWIGNFRGTSYSRGHESYDPDSDLEYWDFSHHESAVYDIPSMIDSILNKTGQPNLYYVGHSVGTLAFFISMSLKTDYNSKIRTMFSMSTSGYLSNGFNPYFRAQAAILNSYEVMKIVERSRGGAMGSETVLPIVGNPQQYCDYYALTCSVCHLAYSLQYGFNPCQTNLTQLPGIALHLPDTSSVKAFSHISQNVVRGWVRQYDYGVNINLQKYNSWVPPRYNLRRVTAPVVIYFGDNDSITAPPDVLRTANELGDNVKEINHVADPLWTHMDNVFGIDADKHIYKKILHIMNTRKYG